MSYVRALVATAGAIIVYAGVAAGPTPAHAEPVDQVAQAATAPPPDTAPLKVRIDTMSPSTLPADGPIVITGTVTNRSEETWSAITLYSFVGDEIASTGVPIEPMRTRRQLDAALDVPFEEVVGERVTDAGVLGSVDELLPGETERYRIRVPVSALAVSRPGVYWFGVHALGQSDSMPLDDGTADGRSRTFLPFVPSRFDATPVPTSLVVPLTRPVGFAADGSVDDVEEWTEALEPEGELSHVLDLAGASSAPVTWLVDPALLDAVGQLATGNRPRSLGPVGTPPSGTGAPSEGTESPTPDEDLASSPSALAAAGWLEELRGVLAGDQVLALPYGNIDVPATLEHAPALYDLALAQQSTVLQGLDVDPARAIAPPSGFLDEASIAAADADARVLVTDRMFGADPPAVADVDGRDLVVTSYAATEGSPGPGPRTDTVGLRQRLLAEAAVRLFRGGPEPLVVTLPTDGRLEDPLGFFAGFDAPWLGIDTVDAVAATATPETVAATDLEYAPRQVRRELDAPTVDAVADLVEAGDSLQSVLVDNNAVGGTLAEEALTGLSYWVRDDQTGGRARTGRSLDWVRDRLDGVRVNASSGVTLSSATGEFAVTVSNDLEYPVTVQIRAESDSGIEVESPGDIELAPGSRSNVFLEARTADNRVHNVQLLLTDTEGVPIGSTDQVPIRSVQVSGVIWLIMGTGAGLLFLAIAVRLVRRIRAARRGDAGDRVVTETPAPVEAV